MTTDERGVVDRIVNDLAVVLVGDADAEHHVPVHELPEGAGEGTWLRVRRADGELTVVGIDADGEERQRDQLDRRMDRIQRGGGGADGEAKPSGLPVVGRLGQEARTSPLHVLHAPPER